MQGMTARLPRHVSAGVLALMLGGACLNAQTTPEAPPPKYDGGKTFPVPNAQSTPEGTPEEKFKALIQEAQTLEARKRYLDALEKLDEAEKIDDKKPEVHNIRGAIYLSSQLRDFDKARAEFEMARQMNPEALPPLFNLAEANYIQGLYAEGEKGFAGVVAKFPKIPQNVRHMILFKELVCLVKQDKLAEANKLMTDSFTFMDDTPAFYFSKAVLALQAKDEKGGNKWLAKAQVIFKKHETSAYLDTMLEGKYIDSISVAGSGEEEKAGKAPAEGAK